MPNSGILMQPLHEILYAIDKHMLEPHQNHKCALGLRLRLGLAAPSGQLNLQSS